MKEKIKKCYGVAKREMAKHLSDSTALSVLGTPVFAAIETFVAHMPIEKSEEARIWGAKLTYLGMGKLYTGGMKYSRKKFNISSNDNKKTHIHDALYGVAYNLAIGPLFYWFAAGVRDPKQIALGTLGGAGLALFIGGPAGYTVDAYQDFFGIEDSKRLPISLRNKGRTFKLGLAGILAATSIGLTEGVYSLKNYINNYNNHSQIEQQAGVSRK